MSPRNTKLILRTGILVLAALTLALAVRLVLENRELEKLLPATSTRTLLLIAAPATSLAMLHLVLAVRTLSVRSLAMETSLLLGEAALFISIVSPLLIGNWVNVAADNCGRWLRACSHELTWVPTWWLQPASIAVSVVLIVSTISYAVSRQ